MRDVLLIEPKFKSRYPPLGLMKISSFHKLLGDNVYFYKGFSSELRDRKWDRIYISTLFTYYWKETIKAFDYYKDSTKSGHRVDIFLGGAAATLLRDELRQVTGATVLSGLLDKPGQLDAKSRIIVDSCIPDYNILEETEHNYSHRDSYLSYATRGCPNNCSFCAVGKIEPVFNHYLPLKRQIMKIEEIYGQKQHLILMDNNVLASDSFERIIDDICELGFEKGAKLNNRKRYVDFNQGTDARLLDEDKARLLSRVAIKPLRIAFDHISMKDTYTSAVRLAARFGHLNLSNYVLYNYKDTPEGFYERLRINVELNEELGTKIYSFPMKYIPLTDKDRTFIGKNWNKKMLRGIQCVLLATRGLVSPRTDFFNAAFGNDFYEFMKIILMPEEYIINRKKHINLEAKKWSESFDSLTKNELAVFISNVSSNTNFKNKYVKLKNTKIKSMLEHYITT